MNLTATRFHPKAQNGETLAMNQGWKNNRHVRQVRVTWNQYGALHETLRDRLARAKEPFQLTPLENRDARAKKCNTKHDRSNRLPRFLATFEYSQFLLQPGDHFADAGLRETL
jgi:hypothetical protein